SHRLHENHPNLLQGLAELHSIWYDEIDSSIVADIWMSMLKKAAVFKPVSPRRLGFCMRKLKFRTYEDNVQDPELYCLGAVVEDGVGADVILASIALEIGRGFGLRGAVAHKNGAFGVLHISTGTGTDGKDKILSGTMLSSENDWRPTPIDDPSGTEVWSTRSVFKYVAAMLFVNAACSEGPRYIQILASCLAERKEHESLEEILPYPFGSA
ncbi:MAG: hypothetical protein KAG97_13440, partial [Victivallales bacterium]|nr:hypothetical protein [Victivallales bacterium]